MIPRMHEHWDIAILDGEPVVLRGESADEVADLRFLVDKRPDDVRAFVQNARAENGSENGAVTLWLNPAHMRELATVPQDLL